MTLGSGFYRAPKKRRSEKRWGNVRPKYVTVIKLALTCLVEALVDVSERVEHQAEWEGPRDRLWQTPQLFGVQCKEHTLSTLRSNHRILNINESNSLLGGDQARRLSKLSTNAHIAGVLNLILVRSRLSTMAYSKWVCLKEHISKTEFWDCYHTKGIEVAKIVGFNQKE